MSIKYEELTEGQKSFLVERGFDSITFRFNDVLHEIMSNLGLNMEDMAKQIGREGENIIFELGANDDFEIRTAIHLAQALGYELSLTLTNKKISEY